MTEPILYQGKYRVASARLPGYDYGQRGAYFVTICTAERQPYFGSMEVPAGDWDAAFVRPSMVGQRVREGWDAIPTFASFVTLDAFVLMPDHVHGVLLFDKAEDLIPSLSYENRFGPQHANLAAVLRGFKAGVSSFARAQQMPFAWQPRFYDRIVRSESELTRIRDYILTNPSRWQHEWDNGEGLYR
ncbi:transposase [Hymenobacter rubripertinctus]|uniref:Transposase n=1 Tax=Hymenobacter rubripertinctus TaxID=2029981 RepID=A0A418R7L7_9BACT|nr:transposase [Hymenobacter rubripertinctus]RIY13386.1 transposase [Hymenobacter rubripertinctus]